jgi:hypothetical protein
MRLRSHLAAMSGIQCAAMGQFCSILRDANDWRAKWQS